MRQVPHSGQCVFAGRYETASFDRYRDNHFSGRFSYRLAGADGAAAVRIYRTLTRKTGFWSCKRDFVLIWLYLRWQSETLRWRFVLP